MFKKILTIKNVNKGCCISNNQLFFQSGKEIVQYDMAGKKELLRRSVSDDFRCFVKRDDLIIGISGLGYTFFDSQLHVVRSIRVKNGIGDYCLYNSNLVVVTTDYDYTLFLPKEGVQDIFSDEVLWESNSGEVIEIGSNIAFTVSLKGVSRRGLGKGELKWFVETSSGKYLPNLVGVSNDVAVFSFKDLDKLIAFDVETGKVKYEIKTFARGLCIDEKKGLLHQMLANYAAYDLLTGELKDNYQDFSYFKSVGVETQRSNYVMMGEHIITTDWKEGVIGAFNTTTHKFDWVHKMGGVSFPPPAPIVYQNSYLLLYDNLGALHIFDRVLE
ncbi:hypothetical protein [Microbulbifer sp. GL-2]|uniref:hypothetical protein n=1 Tax=Microbulbifer sp. GL-2 TaxID=2591606 RepID=UPI001165C6C1|nr:hypothetical protein [Microbulbifer sp. GL-2]BBM02719.1 hypothetical protein GL2_27930 [Microbulbifer sp. GL-2]